MTRLKVINMRNAPLILSGLLVSFLSLLPKAVLAHEVYLLTPEEIDTLANEPRISFFAIFSKYLPDTIWWAVLIGFLIVSIFFISISATLENRFDKYLIKLKH